MVNVMTPKYLRLNISETVQDIGLVSMERTVTIKQQIFM